MKKEFYIQIPEPCQADWDQMTPVQQGRFCQSCCKEVVDFTLMTDQAIIDFLSKPRGKTCGNFSTDQLNRAITEPATPAKKRIWVVMFSFLIPLFISTKSKAQRGKLAITSKTQQQPVKCATELRGDTIQHNSQVFGITGKILDTAGNPIAGASVIIKGTTVGTAATDNGRYSLPVAKGSYILTVSALGFSSKEVTIAVSGTIMNDIILEQNENILSDVVVVSSGSTSRRGYIAGGYSVVRVHRITTIADTIQRIIASPGIRVYPNPAQAGSHVLIQPATSSHYEMKLFNSQSQLVLQASFTVAAKRQAYQLELPSTLATGMYVINVTDTKTKKQYTHKLILQ
jgi:hypothetical protein